MWFRSNRRLGRLLLAAMTALALSQHAAPAWAQPDDDVLPTGPGWRSGMWSVTPTVVFTGGYDSNINRESPPIAAQETYALPQVELRWRTPRWIGIAGTTHEFTHFSAAQNGGINWRSFASLRYKGARYSPWVSYDRPRTNARPTGFEIGRRSKHLEDNYAAGADVKATARTSLSVRVASEKIRWDADAAYAGSVLRETLNRNSRSISGSLSYKLTPLTSLTGSGEVSRFEFINSPGRDATTETANVGVEFKSPAMLEGSAWIGVLRLRQVTRAVTDFTGLVASSSIGYARPSGAYTRVQVGRGLTFSYDPSRAYYTLLDVNLSFSRPIGGRWHTVAFAGHHNVDYPEPINGVRPRGNRIEEGGFAAAYQVGPWTRIGGSLEGFSQVGQLAYSGVRVVAFLHIGVGTPRRLDRPIPLTR